MGDVVVVDGDKSHEPAAGPAAAAAASVIASLSS